MDNFCCKVDNNLFCRRQSMPHTYIYKSWYILSLFSLKALFSTHKLENPIFLEIGANIYIYI